jgi:hypothetical protein
MSLNDAGYWRMRADEVRAVSEGWENFKARAAMLDIAEPYERLADMMELGEQTFMVAQS